MVADQQLRDYGSRLTIKRDTTNQNCLTTLVGDHPEFIPLKFGQIAWAVSK